MRDDLDMANSDLTSLPAAGVGFPQASSPVSVGVLFQDVPGPGSRGSARRKGRDRPPAASGLVQPEVETRLLGQIARPQSEKGASLFLETGRRLQTGLEFEGQLHAQSQTGSSQLERARSLYHGSFDIFISRFKRRWRNFGFSSWEGDGWTGQDPLLLNLTSGCRSVCLFVGEDGWSFKLFANREEP